MNLPRFAFLCHPLDFQQLACVDPALAHKSPRLVRQVMAQVPPSHVRTVEIESPTGSRVLAEMICIWLLPDQFRHLEPHLVRTKLAEAMRIAESLECDLVGLGAYTKIAAFAHPDLYEEFPFAITTGNTLTAALATEALEDLFAAREMLRDETELAIVGATGAIGNAVLRAFAPRVARVNLVGRNLRVLEKVAAETRPFGCEVQVYEDAKRACAEARLILLATSEPGLLIQAADLCHRACVVDVSKPVNILPDASRPDVSIIDCAMVHTPPRRILMNWVKCFPQIEGLDSPDVFACFAEAMILALEGRMEPYSQGRTLDIRKFEEIRALAHKHGFAGKLKVGPWSAKSQAESATLMAQFGMRS